MPVEVFQLNDEPIILAVPIDPFDGTKDVITIRQETDRLLKRITDPIVYRIIDLTTAKIALYDVMLGLSEDAGKATARERFVVVGSDELAKMADAGMDQEQYGNHGAEVLPTQEEAIAYARAQLRQAQRR